MDTLVPALRCRSRRVTWAPLSKAKGPRVPLKMLAPHLTSLPATPIAGIGNLDEIARMRLPQVWSARADR